MKIAMLGLYPARPDWILGGEQAVIAMLSQRLSRHPDIDLQVITFDGGTNEPRVERPKDGPVVHRLPHPRFGRLTWHTAERNLLRQALEQMQPDLVHTHGSLVYTAAAVGCGFPTVTTVHGIMAREAGTLQDLRKRAARGLDAWFERYALRQTQDLISISPYVLEAVPWLKPRRVHHIENPVDDRFFDVVRREESLRILCPIRVIPRKGLLFALQALAELCKEFPGLQLHVAGETAAMPSYLETCQGFIAQHGLTEHVRFLDNLSMSALADQYARCTLMLLPSMQETAPVVIGEAMAVGVAVVATRVGGVPHMVLDGTTGQLVDYGDVRGLSAALRSLLAGKAMRQAMEQRARAQAERRFRLAGVAERTRDVYASILNAAGSLQTP